MGVKENFGPSSKAIGREPVRRSNCSSSAAAERLCGRLWQDHRELAFKTKRLLIILTAVLAQHLNLFDLHFQDYNFKLITYIFLLLSVKIAKLALQAVETRLPLQTPGLRSFLRLYRIFAIFGVVYLFVTVYDNLTPLKLLFLTYLCDNQLYGEGDC